MKRWFFIFFIGLIAVPATSALRAGPAVGMPRDEVMLRYGDPRTSMAVGGREVLTHADGKVILEGGRVVSFELAVASGSAETGGMAKVGPRNPGGGWFTDFDQAKEEAKASRRKILALFTGSTWCPACIRFERDVAHDPNFLRLAQKNHVLVKIDFPRGGLPPTSRSHMLAQRYEVYGYPTLLTMNADGSAPAQVDVLAALNQGARAPEEVLARLDRASPVKSKAKIFAAMLGGLALMVWLYKRKR